MGFSLVKVLFEKIKKAKVTWKRSELPIVKVKKNLIKGQRWFV